METTVIVMAIAVTTIYLGNRLSKLEGRIKSFIYDGYNDITGTLTNAIKDIQLPQGHTAKPEDITFEGRKPLKAKSMAQIRRATQRANQEIEAKELNRELNTNSE